MSIIEERVVIAVPVFNEGRYILQALKSLARQTYCSFKVLIADNASTDETEQICKTFCSEDDRFQYIRHDENIGAAANFKYCLDHTASEFFMWLGGHDWLQPDFLKETVGRMEVDDSLSLVYCHTRWENEDGSHIRNSNGGNYIFPEPVEHHERYIRLLHALDRCEAINQLIRRCFLRDMPIKPVVSADLMSLCHLAGHGPFSRIDKPLYVRREFSNRASTAMERIVGKKVAPNYAGLAALFVESVCSHSSILGSKKLGLTNDVLLWLNRKFSLFATDIVEQSGKINSVLASAQKNPFFSVVMPVYNRERYVREAIESVLNQDFSDLELIMVDDGSTDRSLEIVSGITDPRLRVICNNHLGGAAARNAGIAAARGEFIVWVDSDDRQAHGALHAIWKSIMNHPEAGVHYGDLLIFDESSPDKILRTHYPDYVSESLLPKLIHGNCLPNPGTAVRRSLYAEYGGYNTEYRRCHDYQLWGRLAAGVRFKKVDTVLCHWRQHGGSLSSTTSKSFEGKVVQDMMSRYDWGLLYPGLQGDSKGEGKALDRTSRTLEALKEYGPAVHWAHKAFFHGVGDRGRLVQLTKQAGAAYQPQFSMILETGTTPATVHEVLRLLDQQRFLDVEVVLIDGSGDMHDDRYDHYSFPVSRISFPDSLDRVQRHDAAREVACGAYLIDLGHIELEKLNVLGELAAAMSTGKVNVATTRRIRI